MSNEPKIVQASIAPIPFAKLRLPTAQEPAAEPTVDIGVALMRARGIHSLAGVSVDPPRVDAETMTYAVNLCRGIVASIEQMPLTQQAGDTIAIALALLHLSDECERLQADARAEAQRSANRFGSE